jgi:hypothetical protein
VAVTGYGECNSETVMEERKLGMQFAVLPIGTTAKEALQMVYRGEIVLTPIQMRAAIESLPYETPKLSATAIASIDGKTFAEALERATARSATVRNGSLPLLNGNGPVEELPPSVANKPFARPNYRRF